MDRPAVYDPTVRSDVMGNLTCEQATHLTTDSPDVSSMQQALGQNMGSCISLSRKRGVTLQAVMLSLRSRTNVRSQKRPVKHLER